MNWLQRSRTLRSAILTKVSWSILNLRGRCDKFHILHWRKIRRRQATMTSSFVVKDVNSPDQRTFRHDDNLPALPLPRLDDTLEKYLDSCKAVLSNDEFARTRKIVDDFGTSKGPELQKLLEKRSRERRNWLDEWWSNGYLEFRGPSGNLNITGTPCFTFWPIPESQLKSSALQLHITMKFWLLIREEKLRQQKDSRGNPFSMYQFRYIFNTCRIPQMGKDEMFNCFKSVYEGPCPAHIIIFHRQRMYKIQGVCSKTGEIYSPSQFYKILLEIVKHEDTGPGIAALSELDRDSWAEARSHLMQLSPVNKANIYDIDSAVLCFSLCDRYIGDDSDLLKYGVSGSYGERWTDKFNFFCTQNSRFIINCDHTPLDGMVMVTFTAYSEAFLLELKQKKLNELWSEDSSPVESPTELTFTLDDKIKRWILEGKKVAAGLQNQFDCTVLNFDHFGKIGLKKLGRVHPCAFVEICFQLAYMRKHGKPAATYETATTRTFYRGRTETLRTCTPEAVRFCKAMINGTPHRETFFLAACKKYAWLMDECRTGKGCDRHLLGLAMVANEKGEQLPEIFKDPAYTKSGGNGNFLLSTSFVGYSVVTGAVVAMRDDGYGVFYRMTDKSIHVAVSALNQCPETSSESLSKLISQAFLDVYDLMSHGSRL